jgi:enterochelin esterase-like enzyme
VLTRQIRRTTLLYAAVLLASCSLMPDATAQNLVSPEVHTDGRVTLRLRATKANEVDVSLDGKKVLMIKSEDGVWEGTSEPLPPQIYDYTFVVDGTSMNDPSNRFMKRWLTLVSMVEIPGSPPRLTEFTDVPHGTIHRMIYPSVSVGRQRPVMVYTPPDYETSSDRCYPVVVLLHGYGDNETAWMEGGRAHLIADNLIAAGRIEPVVIVMPDGHPNILRLRNRPKDYFERNDSLMESDITNDLLPFVERNFRIRKDAPGRSIAGLSMGGGHALKTGLKHIDLFSSIGAFSADTPKQENEELLRLYPSLSGPEPAANSLKLLWIPIGDKDVMLKQNNTFVEQLVKAGVKHEYPKADGGHEWKLWRDFLPQFLEKVAPK